VFDFPVLPKAASQQHGRVFFSVVLFLHGFHAKFFSFDIHAARCTKVIQG
jgi:hypothetical protein